jgi:two-component system sensor histidine kinase FlrB
MATEPIDSTRPSAALLTPEQLAAAFAQFQEAAEALTHAYGQLEVRAARLTERMEVLLRALPVAVVVVNEEGIISEANSAALAWFGAAVAPGQPWATFAATLVPSGTPNELLVTGQAEPRRVTLTWSQLPDQGGRIAVVQDVTEAAALREAVARQERLAAMGELVAGLAHQLRTPLAAALLFLDHLELPHLSEETRLPLVAKIKGRLQRMERLIADMLLFARGGVSVRGPVALDHLFTQLWNHAAPLAEAQGAHLECLAAPPADAPPVLGDEGALVGAIGNLIDNALAVQQGQPEAWVGLGARVVDGAWEITVADRGPGIDPSVQTRLFTPFFTTRPEGTGLGLAIAHEVVRAHGGTIRVASSLGAGATFTVFLPCGRKDDG